jgi:hypothetical protein
MPEPFAPVRSGGLKSSWRLSLRIFVMPPMILITMD